MVEKKKRKEEEKLIAHHFVLIEYLDDDRGWILFDFFVGTVN